MGSPILLRLKTKQLSLNNVANTLNKTLAKEFYRLNSGFFLLIGTLAFGFMSGVEHKALAQFFASTPLVLLIPVSLWILYTFKVLNFNEGQLHEVRNRMLFNTAFLGNSQQWACTGLCVATQLLPIILYGIFLLAIAWPMAAFKSIAIILLALLVCTTGATVVMIHNFRNPYREKRISAVKQFLDRRYRKPVFQFYCEWLLRKDPLMLAGIKIFSGGLIFGVCMLYGADEYDGRLVGMALTAAGIANLLTVFQLQDFEHNHIGWIKNLPVSTVKRYVCLVAVLATFLIPESVVLLKYYPDQLPEYWFIMALVYLLSLAAFFIGFIHVKASALETFTRKSFWIFIALIMLILFKVPLLLLGLINIALGYIFFSRNYYSFESYRGK